MINKDKQRRIILAIKNFMQRSIKFHIKKLVSSQKINQKAFHKMVITNLYCVMYSNVTRDLWVEKK